MPELTTRLGIKKPVGNETVTRTAFNENWDIIDAGVATQSDFDAHKAGATLDHPDGSVTDVKIGNRTIADTIVPSGNTGSLTTLFGWLGNMIKSITGKSNWYALPAITLEALNNLIVGTAAANKLLKLDANGKLPADITGNAPTATKLATARTLSLTGDATGSMPFNGSANASAAVTLANTGVTAGTYKSVTVDAKGRVSGGTNPTTLNGYGITDALSLTGTAANSSKVGGYSPAQTNTASTAVIRNSSGDVACRLLRQEYPTAGGSCTYILTQNAVGSGVDNYARPVSLDTLKTALGVSVPAGTVIYYAKNTAPAGYLKANGAAVSRTTYAALYSAIGTTFGAGDGSTTFNLPDLRGEFVRGWDNSRGVDSGRALGSVQQDAFQGHEVLIKHNGYDFAGVSSGNYISAGAKQAASYGNFNAVDGQMSQFISDGTNGAPRIASETRPRNVTLLACIKY